MPLWLYKFYYFNKIKNNMVIFHIKPLMNTLFIAYMYKFILSTQ